ncbi:histidine kinase [Bordetella sp. N]|nr:histidine kinase [Bordetella sp. N]
MGEAAGVDRAWLLEYSADMLRFRNTHEWCRGQTSPYLAELQEAPVTLIAWLHKYMMQGQAVAVADVTELPRTARAIQVEFLRQGNKSVLSVPVLRDGKPRGIIGFDTTERHRAWAADEIDALFRCAGLIALARYDAPGRDRPQHQPSPARHAVDTRSPALIYLSMRGVVRGVQPESIVGVRSAGNYSEIWLDSGAMVLDSRALGLWSTLLPERIFFRIHRSAIINALHVLDVDRRSVDRWQIRMRSADRSWSVSRSYRQHLRERMGI